MRQTKIPFAAKGTFFINRQQRSGIHNFSYYKKIHHHVPLVARISLTLSHHSSLSFIALGVSSGQHPVSSHSCWMYVRAGRPAFARPCVGVHKSNAACNLEQVLAVTPHKIPTVRPPASYYENYSSKTNQTCRTLLEKQGRTHTWCTKKLIKHYQCEMYSLDKVGNDSNDDTEKQCFWLIFSRRTYSSIQLNARVCACFDLRDYAYRVIARNNQTTLRESAKRILETYSQNTFLLANNTLKRDLDLLLKGLWIYFTTNKSLHWMKFENIPQKCIKKKQRSKENWFIEELLVTLFLLVFVLYCCKNFNNYFFVWLQSFIIIFLKKKKKIAHINKTGCIGNQKS